MDVYNKHKAEIDQWIKNQPGATVCALAAYIAYNWTEGNKIECPMIPITKSKKCKIGG